MVSEDKVRQSARELLSEVDLDSATQRSVRETLEERLGEELAGHKRVIKDEIETFLASQSQEAAAGPSSGGAEASPHSKVKREEGSDGEADRPTKKARPASPPPGAPPGAIQLSAKRFASVRAFRGASFVDVREFYDKDGSLAPGSKGTALPPPAWAALRAAREKIGEALAGRDGTLQLPLAGKRRVAVREFKGSYGVDIREYYEKDGETLPGKKGIFLAPPQWAALEAAMPELTRQLEAGGME